MPDDHIACIRVENAEAFLAHLSPRGPLSNDGLLPGGWLFRGQRDASLPLLPSVLRQDFRPRDWGQQEIRSAPEQIRVEAALVRDFFNLADRQGLPLPGDSQTLRKELGHYAGIQGYAAMNGAPAWIPDELLSLVGLAQHHRLPTRLLDWTRRSYVAAYFAAAGPTHDHASSLCVWTIRESELWNAEITGRAQIVLVTAPGAGNPNLRAQEAVFLYRRSSSEEVDRTPWEFVLAGQSSRPGIPVLMKFCLPAVEAPSLLRLLAAEGIDASTIYPGFDGVVKAMKEGTLREPFDQALGRHREKRVLNEELPAKEEKESV